jgi:beta-N-acetylhexosaminidase
MSFRPGLHLIPGLLLAALLLQAGVAAALPDSQGTAAEQAQQLLDTLTPQQRVGQLFLVTFDGPTITTESPIYDLISRYHIGGVMLTRENNNFVLPPNTVDSAYTLISNLQRASSQASETEHEDPISGEQYIPAYIPLLVGVSQEGDGYPNDQILGMLSPQPNAMTLGATWNPDYAEQAGELLGRELSALGFNLLMGPSLDVLESPQLSRPGDLGVRSFGGDPYWVGEMGQAYVAGVHSGSDEQIALIAKHLPGYGSSDRLLTEEIPTIRKSLEQLSQIELAPFFAVTGDAPDEHSQVDGMLLSHIRYLGFQGNIRASTRPVSFDPQAFDDLMALPAFETWRGTGGLIISDRLGTRAVRRNYDASETTFNGPIVARDALLAGNDMLYLSNFVSDSDPNSYTTITHTAEFFAQKYREDPAFAELVDAAVLRILTLKYELYPNFTLLQVIPAPNRLDGIGQNSSLIFEIGRQAATLLSPSAADLPDVLPEPPGLNDRIIFLSDSYTAMQCADCIPQNVFSTQAVHDAVMNLYGPNGGNQIVAGYLSSFSFDHLVAALNTPPETENALLTNLSLADWVVFSMLDSDSERAASQALQMLLNERPDLIEDKHVIVFAFDAPFYLDATDITKISAYYGLYNKNGRMADVAARLLFREISAPGASPVSVTGSGYDLIEATSPDPNLSIGLSISQVQVQLSQDQVLGTLESSESMPTPGVPDSPTYRAGDVLSMRAGPILDHNGQRVPDGTPVTFNITINNEGNFLTQQIQAVSQLGFANATYSIAAEGSLDILASSGDPAARSQTRHFDVVGINPEGIALQATQTAFAIMQLTPQAPDPNNIVDPANHDQTTISDWFVIGLVALLAGLFAYQIGVNQRSVRWGIRWSLTTLLGGVLGGTYLALTLPGTRELLFGWGSWGVMSVVLFGAGLGWLAGWRWQRVNDSKPPTNDLSSPPDSK